MRLYVESIRRLRELPSTLILPGHGPPIGGAAHRLDFYLKHRAWREDKILGLLARAPRTLEELLPEAYDDTPPERHAPATRSALAHLLKLRDEGRAEVGPDGRWRSTGP